MFEPLDIWTDAQIAAFWGKVIKGPGCWLWTGATNHGGYGVFGTKPQWRAHRMAYVLDVGPTPKGHMILHACDRPRCVRPNHLWVGTHAENMRDMSKKQRRHGSTNPKAKLTEVDVLEIRAARSHSTAPQLADTYSVSTHTIYSVWGRHTWTHI